jgi:tetratricopeptide (TPR) repeat protein
MLRSKQGDPRGALDLLDEITHTNEKDILAYKTKLDIYTDSGIEPDRALSTYRDIRRLLRANGFPTRMTLSAEFACVRFSVKTGELLREAGELKKSEKRFLKAEQQYAALVNKISADERELEGIIRNAYGCFLIDVLERPEQAIAQLEGALKAWPRHGHTLYKLATILLEQAEILTAEKASLTQRAKDLLKRALKVNPLHYPARLTVARLEGQSIEWGTLRESEYWEKAREVYGMYGEAFEPEDTLYPSLHNAIAHHVAGCFLWHVEARASKRKLSPPRPASVPSADVELSRSTAIGERVGGHIAPNIRDHLVLAYFTLGSYLMTVAKGSPDVIRNAQSHLKKAIDLTREAPDRFRFYSLNSYAESYVGRVFLAIGEIGRAKELLDSAVKTYDRNWRAWWFLERAYELERDYVQAMTCFERSAKGQASPGLFAQLRSIVNLWMNVREVPFDINLRLRFSKQAYELDPSGDLSPKNISDYGYDLYKKGKSDADSNSLKEAQSLLVAAYTKYLQTGLTKEANFPLWYAAECKEALTGHVDQDTMTDYVCSAALENSPVGYAMLKGKIRWHSKYEEAILSFIDTIDRYPSTDSLYTEMISSCCSPIWQSGQTLNSSLVAAIEACATRHADYPAAGKMIGLVLQRNRENERALPYLEKFRASGDPFVLMSLMECYYALQGKCEAEKVCQELYALLDGQEKAKLRQRASTLGLRCG